MKVKAKCARALIRYLKAKESERENSNELCTTKLYNATCRQRVCGQNKDNLCLHAARTLIWRSCAFNRGPMTMPVLDGPMTRPVLDGVKPMAITLPICGTSESLFWKRKKKHILLDSVETNLNIWRVRWPSPRQVRVQIPTSPRQVRDDRKTSRDRTRVLQPYTDVSRHPPRLLPLLTVRCSERGVFITFEIRIFIFSKLHGFTTGGLYSPPEQWDARTLFHVFWTGSSKHPFSPMERLGGARTIFYITLIEFVWKKKVT